MSTEHHIVDANEKAGPSLTALAGSASDAEWGHVLWDWLREMLPDAGCCLEFDTEELMKLAEKHGRASRVKYEPRIHGGICDANPGDEIWWWGDDLVQYDQAHT